MEVKEISNNTNSNYKSNQRKNYNNYKRVLMDNREKTKQMQFASISSMKTTTTTTKITSLTKSNIETYLSDPIKNNKELRAVSDWFYHTNGIYKQVITSFKSLPTLDYIIAPSSSTLDRKGDKSYDGYYSKVKDYADSINIKRTTRNILFNIAKYGGYAAYERSDNNEFSFQTLPLDYCRVKCRIGNDYQLEFNFKYFDKFYQKEDLDFAWEVFPKEFKSLYTKYKNDKKSSEPEWKPLDINKTVFVPYDDDEVECIPLFTGMFEPLLNNEDYKDIIKTGEKLATTKMVAQKVPLDKENRVTLPREMVQGLHNSLASILPEGSTGITSPLSISEVSFSNPSQQKEELLAKAERGVFINSGMSSAIFAESGGHAGLKMNIEVVTANIFSVLEKVEDVLNKKFRNVVKTKNYTFRIKFFRVTNINLQETFTRLFQLVSIGGAMSPLYSVIGFDEDIYNTMLQMENDKGVKDLLVPPHSMHTGGTDTESKESGRPEKKEEELSDQGQTTRDLDSNNNRQE